MWEFPNARVQDDPAAELPRALKAGYKLRLRLKHNLRAERRDEDRPSRRRSAKKMDPLGIVEHGYSHFSVTVHVFPCELLSAPGETNLKWVSLNNLDAYPMGKIDRQIAKMIVK
jgi:adenine-specific DNA glycosylase